MAENPIPYTTLERYRSVTNDNGSYTEVERAALSSVEYTVDAKGVVRVSGVKVYDNDPDEAARRGYAALTLGQELLAQSKPVTP